MKKSDLQRLPEKQDELERRLLQAEKFAMIGRLSGGLAHELGSPLSVISLHAHAIRAMSTKHPLIEQEAEAIEREVQRMSTFLEGLLHLSRRQGVIFRSVDLRDVLDRCAREHGPGASSAGVKIMVDKPETGVMVLGHEAMLCHAVQNVVRNAVQALAHHDGVREVWVRIGATRMEATVTVEDTGPGIPEAVLAHLFEPFHTTKPDGEGMGLGLAVSHGILEEHGGEISISNRASGGVRVAITLPLDPAHHAGPSA